MKLFQEKREIYTSEAVLTLICSEEDSKKLFLMLWEKIEDFYQRFSRFLPQSELSKINQNGGRKQKVSPQMVEFLKASVKGADISDNIFNPFILPDLQKAGYVGSMPNVQEFDPNLNYSGRETSGILDLRIGDDWVQIPANSAIDSGGAGKGYLLDEISREIELLGIENYWFSLGGDIIFAGTNLNELGWNFQIDGLPDSDSRSTGGRKMALATSGVTKRKGENWNHLIDPRTNKSTQSDVLTATVTSDTALEADIFAKTLVILGSGDSQEFISRKKIKYTLLQLKDGAKLTFGEI